MKKFEVTYLIAFNQKESKVINARDYADLYNILFKQGVRAVSKIYKVESSSTRCWLLNIKATMQNLKKIKKNPKKCLLIIISIFIFTALFYGVYKHSSSSLNSTNTKSLDLEQKPKKDEPDANDSREKEKSDKNVDGSGIDKHLDGDELVPPEVPRPPKLEWLPNGMAVRYDKKGRRIVVTNPEDYPYYKALATIKNPNKSQPKPYFKHDIENSLWNFAVPGQEVPPIPNNFSEADVAAALEEPLVIEEGDTENDIYKKEAVQMLKDEMKDYLAEGHTIEEYFEEIAKRQQAEADLVNETRTMAMRSLENDEIDLAVKLIDKLNEHLKEKGLPPMKLPAPYRKYLKEYQGK